MKTFNLRELRRHTDDLVGAAEAGDLSLVTRHGRPVLVAVPVTRRLIELGVFESLAVKLFAEGVLSLSKAARLAEQPLERFLEALAAAGVDAVSYPPEELDAELANFA